MHIVHERARTNATQKFLVVALLHGMGKSNALFKILVSDKMTVSAVVGMNVLMRTMDSITATAMTDNQ